MTIAARPSWCWGRPSKAAAGPSWQLARVRPTCRAFALDYRFSRDRDGCSNKGKAHALGLACSDKRLRRFCRAICGPARVAAGAPEEARQDPSWRPLSSDSSVAVRAGWWFRWHPTLVARCGAASAPKGAETAPDLAKAMGAPTRGGSGCRGFSTILLERLVGLTSGLKSCTCPDLHRARIDLASRGAAGVGSISGKTSDKHVCDFFV